MLSKILLNICLMFHFASDSHCLRLENDKALLKLINITGLKLEGLGFLNTEPEFCDPIGNPFVRHLPNTCENIVQKGNGKSKSYSFFPNFKGIYRNCLQEFMVIENQICFATCIFYGIITKEKYYALRFIYSIKQRQNVFFDKSAPFPHWVAFEFNTDENVFCLAQDYRKRLLDNIVTCGLLSPKEFCIIDETALHCESNLGNCNFDEREASVVTSGNTAHVITCGTLDRLNWKYFENSTKLQCILPGNKIFLLDTHRKVFKDCHVCSGRNRAMIEFPIVPNKQDFSKVVYSVRPIIIRNATTSERIPPLNFKVLKSIYQDFLFGNWKPCNLQMWETPFESFKHAFSNMSKGDVPFYMRWGVCEPSIRKKFGSIIKTRLSFLPSDYPAALGAPWVYASSPGYENGCHYDHFREITWQAQLSGKKRWRIGPPPECNHICKEMFEVTVNQGDLILIYTNTWLHGVIIEGTDPSLAIGIEYELK